MNYAFFFCFVSFIIQLIRRESGNYDRGRENTNSIDGICAAIAYAMGIEAPKCAAPKNYELGNYIDKVFDGKKADRVVMYNPDAIAQWIYEKYPHFFNDVKAKSGIEIPLATVMPSVTPVCFGTMYTGAQPEVHGIQKYEKPIITIDTLFDALIRAGKKCALITYGKYSLSRIYLGRDIDYYHFEEGGIAEGFILQDITVDENPMQRVCVAIYKNGEKSLMITVRSFLESDLETVEISDEPVEIYEVSGTEYYIFENAEQLRAAWIKDSYECYISGELTIEEIKTMIDSIGKG